MPPSAPRSGPYDGLDQWVRVWRGALLIATPLAAMSVAWVYFGMKAMGKAYSLPRALLAGLPDWYFWAAVSPIIFWLGHRLRADRGRWVAMGAIHAAIGIVVALTELAFVTVLNRAFDAPSFAGDLSDAYLRVVLQYFHLNFLVYCFIVAAAHASRYYRTARSQELEATRLAAELSAAKVGALQLQLQPHFFFNTLHTIAGMVRDDEPGRAVAMIARLGDLFRRASANMEHGEISLREELDFISAYLDVERSRYSDRLRVHLDVSTDALDAQLPAMALQPLVENAIRHGIARDPKAELISLMARRHGDRLRVAVSNEGPRFDETSRRSTTGLGLRNTTERIRRLYGAEFEVLVLPRSGPMTVVQVEVPWRSAIAAGAMR